MSHSESQELIQLPQHKRNVRVQLMQDAPGEGGCHYEDEHSLFISRSSRPVRYSHTQDGKTHIGIYRQGDILLTPAKAALFTRWQDPEDCLQIRFNSQFLQKIAQETLDRDSDNLELLPTFQVRDNQLQAIAMMLATEFQNNSSNELYLDSLTNVLAINLLRQYTVSKPKVPFYEGGLPPRQLNQILDYIDTNLDQNIKLADLAQLLDLSAFHFSRLFKQSINTTPHQYLSQQRVERAKKLLKQSDLLIIDIALECGFSSHSHLSKQFRRITGTTPKAYRLS